MQVTKTDGTDGGSVSAMAPLEAGKRTTILISRGPGYCGGWIRFGGTFEPETTTGWRIQVTPVKVGEMDTVMFRLVWARAIVDGRRVEDTGNDVELTLRVGQTVPVDIQPWAAHPGQSCGTNQAVVSVGVGPPPQEMDRQLVVTELWLIDKTPSGAEQTQRLTLRGRYGEIQRFYFDDIDGPDRSLDLSGDVLALAREDGVELQIATQRRRTSYDGNVRDYATAITRLRLRPTDTAAVELPKAEAVRDPFHGHTLSLRIQSREVRPAIGAQPASALSGPRAK